MLPNSTLSSNERSEVLEHIRGRMGSGQPGMADRTIYNGNHQREKDMAAWNTIMQSLRDSEFYAQQFIDRFGLATDFVKWKAGQLPAGDYTFKEITVAEG